MLLAWGANRQKECCTGEHGAEVERVPRLANSAVSSPAAVIAAVACGEAHTLLLTQYGDVLACGRSKEGQLGLELQVRPKYVAEPARIEALRPRHIVSIAAGSKHSLAVARDGRAFEWGLLLPTDAAKADQEFVSRRQGIGKDFLKDLSDRQRQIVGASWNAYLTNGQSDAADKLDVLQVLSGHEQRRSPVAMPRECPGMRRAHVVTAACGWGHSVLATSDGGLFASGYNEKGQLGIGSRLPSSHFQRVRLPDGVTAAAGSAHRGRSFSQLLLDCGFNHTAAVAEGSGELYTWGLGTFGQLGLGHDWKESCLPRSVAALQGGVAFVACGDNHTVVCNLQGEVYAFGHRDAVGGQSHQERRPEPCPLLGHEAGQRVRGLFAGGSGCFATVESNGEQELPPALYAWGYNQGAQLGRGVAELQLLQPGMVALPRLPGARLKAFSAGCSHCMAVTESPGLAVLPLELGEPPVANPVLLQVLRDGAARDVAVIGRDREEVQRAHRCILRARCPALVSRLRPAEGLCGGWELRLEEHSRACIRALMEYLYCDFCLADRGTAAELRALAEDLGLERLVAGAQAAAATESAGGQVGGSVRWVRSANGRWEQKEVSASELATASTYAAEMGMLVALGGRSAAAEDALSPTATPAAMRHDRQDGPDYVELVVRQADGACEPRVRVARTLLVSLDFFRVLLEGGFASSLAEGERGTAEVVVDSAGAFVLCLRLLATGDRSLLPTGAGEILAVLAEAHRLCLPDIVAQAELAAGNIVAMGTLEPDMLDTLEQAAELYDLSKLASEVKAARKGLHDVRAVESEDI